MLKYNVHNIGGKEVKNNERYVIYDNTDLERLSVSRTELHRNQETTGHSHADKEEVYYFIMGQGRMQVGMETQIVREKDVVLVPAGQFHKVWNSGDTNLVFIAIFEGSRNHG